MGQTHLIRVEGVNLAAILDDTDDISTRRGGSALLRDVPAQLHLTQAFRELTPVSSGASAALFSVETTDANALVRRIAEHLTTAVPHATYVVDAAPIGDDPAAALLEVTARNRFQQLQQPTVAVPEPADADAKPCAIDRLRPAAREIMLGESRVQVSASVADRRAEGQRQRDGLLAALLADSPPKPGAPARRVTTTHSLTDLADDKFKRFGNLGGKMAVLYADGNGFGSITRALSNDLERLHDFDERVQGLHRTFLAQLIDSAEDDDAFRLGKDLRLEVLLWGGDEMMLAVPGWKGMETLQRFFEAVATDEANAAEQRRRRTDAGVWSFRLTYSAGLVFCGAKTPIAEIDRTAKSLAERVKDAMKERSPKPEDYENLFDYLVLESVDYPTQGIEDHRARHFGQAAAWALAPLAPFTKQTEHDHPLPWSDRVHHLAGLLRERYPRGAIRDLAQAWLDRYRDLDSPTLQRLYEDEAQRFQAVNGAGLLRDLHLDLFRYLVPNHPEDGGLDHAGWLHLTELWDYLAPEQSPTAARIPEAPR